MQAMLINYFWTSLITIELQNRHLKSC